MLARRAPRSALRTVISTFVFFALFAAVAIGGTPDVMNYQGRLTDDLGNPLTGNFDLTFNLYDVAVGGASLWTEVHLNVSVSNGLFNVLLGESNSLTDVEFEATERYLGIAVEADPEMAPRTQITSVAYAYRVATVDSATGGTMTGSIHLNSDDAVNAMEITQTGLGRGLRIGMDNVFSTEAALAIVTQAFAPAIAIVPDGGGPAIQVTSAFGDPSIQFPSQSISGEEITNESVTSNDLATGSVGTDEIANESVTSDDLATGSVGTDEIADGTIVDDDIATHTIRATSLVDEPGVGQDLATPSVNLTGTPKVVARITILCPASGYMLLTATAQGSIVHANGQGSNILFGVTEDTTTFDTDQSKGFYLASNLPTGDYLSTMTATKIYPAPVGVNTYYVIAEDQLGPGPKTAGRVTFTAVFFPTAYATVEQ